MIPFGVTRAALRNFSNATLPRWRKRCLPAGRFPLRSALFGTRVQTQIPMNCHCRLCNGYGADPKSKWMDPARAFCSCVKFYEHPTERNVHDGTEQQITKEDYYSVEPLAV